MSCKKESLFQVAKTQLFKFLASFLSSRRSFFISELAREIVRSYDNNCNEDIGKNGESLLLNTILANRESGLFIDVGANKGDWSAKVLTKNFRGRLFAVDPLLSNIEKLKKRFEGVAGFYPLQYALSDSIKDADFFSNANGENSGTDSLHNMTGIGYTADLNVVKVKCTTLESIANEFKIDKIDFLKIDTEGNEFFVLKGAQQLLSKGSIDFIQIEFGHAWRAARVYLHDVVGLINKYEYDIYIIKPNGFLPLRFTPFIENRYSYINLLIMRRQVSHLLKDQILSR